MANVDPTPDQGIATQSVGDGLDFACNLLACAIFRCADQRPEASHDILKALAEYVTYRYVGEDLLALESLVLLGRDLSSCSDTGWPQFWRQLEWVGQQMDVSLESLVKAG